MPVPGDGGGAIEPDLDVPFRLEHRPQHLVVRAADASFLNRRIGQHQQRTAPEDELPEKWSEYVELNEKYTAEWPVIDAQKEPLPEADEFKDVEDKRQLLDPTPGG